jgi:uncharacterized membrane protein YidH (DUF202 family)
MLFFIEIMSLAAFRTFLVSIPESVGLLAFGIGLVIIAVLIRSFLARGEKVETDDKVTKKA